MSMRDDPKTTQHAAVQASAVDDLSSEAASLPAATVAAGARVDYFKVGAKNRSSQTCLTR